MHQQALKLHQNRCFSANFFFKKNGCSPSAPHAQLRSLLFILTRRHVSMDCGQIAASRAPAAALTRRPGRRGLSTHPPGLKVREEKPRSRPARQPRPPASAPRNDRPGRTEPPPGSPPRAPRTWSAAAAGSDNRERGPGTKAGAGRGRGAQRRARPPAGAQGPRAPGPGRAGRDPVWRPPDPEGVAASPTGAPDPRGLPPKPPPRPPHLGRGQWRPLPRRRPGRAARAAGNCSSGRRTSGLGAPARGC